MLLSPSDEPFGIYIHWPFCAAKCPYCDFNSHVRHHAVDEPRFAAAFKTEMAHLAPFTKGKTVTSIFFGGGTPSLMQPQTLGTILEGLSHHWTIAPDAEITMEANPTSVEAARLHGYRAAGVNRISLGVQALNNQDLRKLGRLHSVEEALAAVDLAASIFPRMSFDLIYARPGQSLAEWEAELKLALTHAVEHLSLYQLTIEPGTWYEKLYKAGKLRIPDSDHARALYDLTQDICNDAGLPLYEISNHARLGAESRHNLIYWRYGDYAGFGPGAHGRLSLPQGRIATATEYHPENWLSLVEAQGHGFTTWEALDRIAQGDEMLLMGLRLKEGIDPHRYYTLTGRQLDKARIAMLVADGLMHETGLGYIGVTPAGLPVLDAVVADLAA